MSNGLSSTATKTAATEVKIPLYYQIERAIRERIETAEFDAGDPLPSEEALCEHYGVSRITIRRALAELHRQRLIVRRHGVGSFVAEKPLGINSHLSGSLKEFLGTAATLHVRCLSLEEAEPPAEVREVFSLADDETATLLRSVGSLSDESPVAYLEIWFPNDIGRQLRMEDIGGYVPVVRLVEQKLNLRLMRAQQFIEPGQATSSAAKYLKINAKSPILRVKRIYYAHPDRPIEIAYVRYHPDRYRFAIEFKA